MIFDVTYLLMQREESGAPVSKCMPVEQTMRVRIPDGHPESEWKALAQEAVTHFYMFPPIPPRSRGYMISAEVKSIQKVDLEKEWEEEEGWKRGEKKGPRPVRITVETQRITWGAFNEDYMCYSDTSMWDDDDWGYAVGFGNEWIWLPEDVFNEYFHEIREEKE